MRHFISLQWKLFNQQKYVQTYIYNRRIISSNLEDMNANKVFNYLIQAHETELNIKTIIELQRYLLDKKTDLVLYGYDSFLFDFSGTIVHLAAARSDDFSEKTYIVDKWNNKYHKSHTYKLPNCDSCTRIICKNITQGGIKVDSERGVCNLCKPFLVNKYR